MAIVIEQAVLVIATSNVTTLSLGSGDGWTQPSADNLMVAIGGCHFGTTDEQLDITTPTGFTQQEVTGANFSDQAHVSYKVATGSGETTITQTHGSADEQTLAAYELSGIHATTPIEASAEVEGGFDDVSSRSSGTATSTNANSLAIAAWSVRATAASAPSGLSYTNSFSAQDSILGGGANDNSLIIATKTVGSESVESTLAWTSAVAACSSVLIIINEAVVTSPAAGLRTLTLTGVGI